MERKVSSLAHASGFLLVPVFSYCVTGFLPPELSLLLQLQKSRVADPGWWSSPLQTELNCKEPQTLRHASLHEGLCGPETDYMQI